MRLPCVVALLSVVLAMPVAAQTAARAAPVAVAGKPAAALTEKAVRDLIAAMERASDAQDMDAIGVLLGDDVEVLLYRGNSQTAFMRLNKRQYLDQTNSTWNMTQNYRYKASNTVVTLAGNTATVTADTVESGVSGGRFVRSAAKTTTTVEWLNGKALITRAVGRLN